MKNSSKREKETGLSLIELVITAALFLILIGPLLSFLRAGQTARSVSTRITDAEQNARAAILSISRDIQNAGYNFAPRVPLGLTAMMRPLILPTGSTELTPVIPGNNLNLVRSSDWTSSNPLTSNTDQITLSSIDQNFNNGLPLSGTLTISTSPAEFVYKSSSSFSDLYTGDFALLSSGQQFSIGVVTAIAGNHIFFTNNITIDPYSLNQAPTGPLADLDPIPQTGVTITLYKIFFISYFVDEFGNLIRREQSPPLHTTLGGLPSITPAALSGIDTRTYTCGESAVCYYDNIIATGIEDLQFRYFLADPSAVGLSGFVDDPGYYGSAAAGASSPNLGITPVFRLLDIRQIQASIKTRAAERDDKQRDPHDSRLGYLYRFTLEGTYNTRNFYGADYRPN